MASTPREDMQEEFLSTIRKSQETVLEAIKSWVETAQSITPKLPAVQVPGADKLPNPEDLVASAYDFAEKLLSSQRKFADEVIKATQPLPGPPGIGGGERPAPRPLPGPPGIGGGERPAPGPRHGPGLEPHQEPNRSS